MMNDAWFRRLSLGAGMMALGGWSRRADRCDQYGAVAIRAPRKGSAAARQRRRQEARESVCSSRTLPPGGSSRGLENRGDHTSRIDFEIRFDSIERALRLLDWLGGNHAAEGRTERKNPAAGSKVGELSVLLLLAISTPGQPTPCFLADLTCPPLRTPNHHSTSDASSSSIRRTGTRMTTRAPAPPPPPEPRVLRAHEAGVQALAFLPGNGGNGQQQLVSGCVFFFC